MGPLGYGPSSADPETGEIISGMAYHYGAGVDRQAQQALEIVRVLNADLSIDRVVAGTDVVTYMQNNRQEFDPRGLPAEALAQRGTSIREMLLTPEMRARLDVIRANGLEEVVPGAAERRREQIRGTKLETLLLNDELISGLSPLAFPEQAIDNTTQLSAEQLRGLSPLDWLTSGGDQSSIYQAREEFAARNNIWLEDFADDTVAGLALEVWKKFGKTKDYEAMFQYLREKIFRAVAEHEVGHTVGLRHNFQGSYDSVNYHNRYWDLRASADGAGNGGLVVRDPLAEDEQLSFGEVIAQMKLNEQQKNQRMREFQYSSIMDYASRFNTDIQGLGKYDEAAIAFAYGGHVEVFDNASADARRVLRKRYADCASRYEGRTSPGSTPLLEEWHYSSVWNLLGQNNGLRRRRFRPWSAVNSEATKGDRRMRQVRQRWR